MTSRSELVDRLYALLAEYREVGRASAEGVQIAAEIQTLAAIIIADALDRLALRQ